MEILKVFIIVTVLHKSYNDYKQKMTLWGFWNNFLAHSMHKWLKYSDLPMMFGRTYDVAKCCSHQPAYYHITHKVHKIMTHSIIHCSMYTRQFTVKTYCLEGSGGRERETARTDLRNIFTHGPWLLVRHGQVGKWFLVTVWSKSQVSDYFQFSLFLSLFHLISISCFSFPFTIAMLYLR